MHPLPHRYQVRAEGSPGGPVLVTSQGLADLETHAPREFDGPPGYWSPESLLAASVADCYILSFRAVARASKLEWSNLAVDVEAVLDRAEGVTRFVRFVIRPQLSVATAERETLARTVLDKAKRACLVTNSLSAECELAPTISVVQDAPVA